MALIEGVELPKKKRLCIALTYVYGIGLKTAYDILKEVGIDPSVLVKSLSEDEIVKIRGAVSKRKTEGDLRRRVVRDIKRLEEIKCYRGSRHRKKLPCRGQRTHTNSRTKRGARIAVAGKKKAGK